MSETIFNVRLPDEFQEVVDELCEKKGWTKVQLLKSLIRFYQDVMELTTEEKTTLVIGRGKNEEIYDDYSQLAARISFGLDTRSWGIANLEGFVQSKAFNKMIHQEMLAKKTLCQNWRKNHPMEKK